MDLSLDPRVGITKDEREHIRAHYSRALPWLERHFGGTPLLFASFPLGWDGDRVFHKVLEDLPATIGTVEARTLTGVHAFERVDAHNVTWLFAKYYAVELDGWSPTLDDPQRASFARIVLSPHGSTSDAVFSGARVLAGRL